MPTRVLILSIDRDDDLGVKTSIRSPVMGREAVLDAATRLALADPTESDANALFGAVKLFDELRAKGEEAEVAAVSGHPNVGLQSDRTVAAQLDEVVQKTGARNVIVVSDGADDEFVLPLVQSRLKVEAMHRVVVAQNVALKGFYYQMQKALDSPRFGRKVLLPAGAMFLMFAAFAAAGHVELASTSVIAFLGGYLVLRGLGWGEELEGAVRSLESFFSQGGASFLFYLAAAAVAVLGALVGYTDVQDDWLRRGSTVYAPGPMPTSLMLMAKFGETTVPWLGIAASLVLMGRILGLVLRDRNPMGTVGAVFYAWSVTLVLYGIAGLLLSMGGISAITFPLAMRGFGFALAGAVVLGLVGVSLGRGRKHAAPGPG
ncbi:MAG: DUF373 family protein [Halobacteria archaeon]